MPKIGRDSERPGAPGENVAVGSEEEVRARLIQFANSTFGSWSAMERAAEIPHTTAVAWRRRGAPLPGTENLLKLAKLGLSLDWLATGRGSMQMRLGSLSRGAMLEVLRPCLQRNAGVGDHTAQQAFAGMVLRLGIDPLLELAARGLAGEFDRELARLQLLHQHGDIVRWMWQQLAAIEASASTGDNDNLGALFDALRSKLVDYLPAETRPGAPHAIGYWQALEAGQLAVAEEAMRQVQGDIAAKASAKEGGENG